MRSRSMPIIIRAFTITCSLATVTIQSVRAQDSVMTVTIAGVVRDTGGRVLAGAEVRSGERFTLTSDSGTFVLGELRPDTVELSVRRIGYNPVSTAFVIRPGLTVSVAVRMTPSNVTLGTILVEGKKVDSRLWKSGFYERAKLGSGTFFTPEYLEHHGSSVSGLVAEVPGVGIQRDVRGRASAIGHLGSKSCPMNVFIDGTLVRWAGDVGLDAILPKDDILAVEVYPRAAFVPSVLVGSGAAAGGATSGAGGASGVNASTNSMMTSQGQRSDCGAIFFWTKPFEPASR
jgi:hypothetical protein